MSREEMHPVPAGLDRRAVLRAGGTSVMTFLVAGEWVHLSPKEAQAAGAALRSLTGEQAETLGAVGEAFCPGAREAGIVAYVDAQLSGPLAECLLFARLVGIEPPYLDFYNVVLRSLETCSGALHEGRRFAALTPSEQSDLLSAMHDGKLAAWKGPPAPFAYFVLRNDAVDVRYGTEDGFAELSVPYMAHISPPRKW